MENYKCGFCLQEAAKYLETREYMWLCQLEAAIYLETYKVVSASWRLPYTWRPISEVSACWRLPNTWRPISEVSSC
jgi:hypothetical protein